VCCEKKTILLRITKLLICNYDTRIVTYNKVVNIVTMTPVLIVAYKVQNKVVAVTM